MSDETNKIALDSASVPKMQRVVEEVRSASVPKMQLAPVKQTTQQHSQQNTGNSTVKETKK